jgi:hypothetical protein
VPGPRRHDTVNGCVPERHRHHDKGAGDYRRGWGRDAERAAGKADREGDDDAERRFHGRFTSKPAVTKPSVMATKITAPTTRGGAGEGISKARQKAPTTNPRAIPAAALSIGHTCIGLWWDPMNAITRADQSHQCPSWPANMVLA